MTACIRERYFCTCYGVLRRRFCNLEIMLSLLQIFSGRDLFFKEQFGAVIGGLVELHLCRSGISLRSGAMELVVYVRIFVGTYIAYPSSLPAYYGKGVAVASSRSSSDDW